MQGIERIAIFRRSRRTKKIRLRPGGQNQVVALVALPMRRFDRMGVRVDRGHLGHFYVDIGVVVQNAAQIKSNIAGTKDRRRHLVEQWLELLIVVLVEQRHPYAWL